MSAQNEDQNIKERAIALFQEGKSIENIAVILGAEVESIERIVLYQQKKIIEAPSKEKGKEARNEKIRQEYIDGKTAKYLSDKHNLHVSSIYIICKGIKKKPKPKSLNQKLKPKTIYIVPRPPADNEQNIHQFEPRYTERRVLFGTVDVYVGDICILCGKTVQLLKRDW